MGIFFLSQFIKGDLMQATKDILDMIEKGDEERLLKTIKNKFHIKNDKAAKSLKHAFEITPDNVEEKIKKEIKKYQNKMNKEEKKYQNALNSFSYKDTTSIMQKHNDYKSAINELEKLL